MANSNDKLGGSDFNNGDQLPAGNLNDTFDAVPKVKRVFFSDGIERTSSGVTWTDSNATASVTFGSDGTLYLLEGIRFRCKLKTNNASYKSQVRLKITDADGDVYYARCEAGDTYDPGIAILTDYTDGQELPLLETIVTSNPSAYYYANGFTGTVVNGETTIQVQIRSDSSSGTVSIDDVSCTAVYVEDYL